jgi:uncharacterized protein
VTGKEGITMVATTTKLAMISGASTGIGYFLAQKCAEEGYDILIAADEPQIENTAHDLAQHGTDVRAVQADLATLDGVDEFLRAANGRPIDVLIANAGRGLGNGLLDQDFQEVGRVIDTNISGTLYLIQKVGREMRNRDAGRILILGSIAGFIPGAFTAVYNGSKAFLNSFSFALRAELDNTGVTVTCLMPGATETDFFERAGMLDTEEGAGKKDDPMEVARIGFEAMMRGEGDVVSGWHNKLRTILANVTPSEQLAARQKKVARPGSARS